MNKFFKKTKGAISIFLVLIMLPMFTGAGLIVDGARISAARTALTGAGDLTMNAALSEYDQILLDVYGLFAMSESTEDLERNVSRYFSNTIDNAGIMEGSDSYTRSFINSIGSLFATDEVSFDNIVDTQVEAFSLVEIPNSALANPTVLERQIVEYMKYRGPVSIGTGLLTKLGCLGETSKQTKAIEAKVDYEKKLDTVQDACETAYKYINAYNKKIAPESGLKFSKEDYLTTMANDIAEAKKEIEEMAGYILAYKSSALKVESFYNNSPGYKDIANVLIANKPLSLFRLDGDTKKAVEKFYKDSKAEVPAAATMDYIEECLKGTIELYINDKGEYDYELTEFFVIFGLLDGKYETELSRQIAAITVHNEVPGMKRAFTYALMYSYYYDMLSEEDQALYSKKHEKFSETAQVMLASSEFCSSYRASWKDQAQTHGKTAATKLHGWYAAADSIEATLSDAIEALGVIIEKVDELDSARTNWSSKVDNLSDSEVKTSMENDYKNSAEDLNEQAISDLKEVLETNKAYFTAIKAKIKSVKFYGIEVHVNTVDENVNFYDRYASKIPEVEISSLNFNTQLASVMKNYTTADVTTGITPSSFSKVTEDEQFYRYLKNMCSNIGTTEEAAKSAKEDREQLINGSESNSGEKVYSSNGDKTADTSGMTTGSYITPDGVTAEIQKAIEDLANCADQGADSFSSTTINTGEDDDKMADNCKSNLNEITKMLDGLTKIAETARDYVYLEEYVTEMFSCYTSGLQPGTNMSLSHADMSSNKFYRSEVEYILYGLDTVQGNLNAAKASIFGVRFALNSVYALTSNDTRAPALTAATAIAGWTGFGVPIVQTVILLAWSLAESLVDLECLCKGESVVLYKSRKTWVLGLNGLAQAGKDAVSTVVDDVFSKLENATINKLDDLTGIVNEYVSETTTGLSESIHGSIMSAIERLALQVVGESNYNLKEEDIGKRVDEMLNSIVNSNTGESAVAKATTLAIETIKTQQITDDATGEKLIIRDYLVKQIYNAYTQAKDGAMTAVSEKIQELLDKVSGRITSVITDAVDSVGDKLKEQVTEIYNTAGDQVKEKVSDAIDQYLGDLSGGGGGSPAAASGFAMSYKEYMKMFMLLSITLGKTSMLTRTAEMIQANMAQQPGNFDITKAYTMVEVNATISIRTTFFDVPVSSGVDAEGNPIYELEFGNIGSGRQEVKYVGILGY